ncbi:MAG: hypothetical protein Kow0042_23070 [Calditrichia bacterium]
MILACWVLFPFSANYAQNLVQEKEAWYQPILSYPGNCQTNIFLSLKDGNKFGGSIGKIFPVWHLNRFASDHYFAGIANIKTLTLRDGTIFNLRDVDYLLGGGWFAHWTDNYWSNLTIQHISSHLGDSFFHEKYQGQSRKQPLIFSLEFVQLANQLKWNQFKFESGIMQIYHTTIPLSKVNVYLGVERNLIQLNGYGRIFFSAYYAYAASELHPLQQIYQIGLRLDLPGVIPANIVFEAKKGQLFWGQFYSTRDLDYLIKLYITI